MNHDLVDVIILPANTMAYDNFLNSFSSPRLERVGRVLLGCVVGGTRNVSEWHRLCSLCVNSTSLRLSRVMKNSGFLHFLVMNVASEWANIVLAVVDGLIERDKTSFGIPL